MEEVNPIFPLKLVICVERPDENPEMIEDDVYENQEDLESELEWIDTRQGNMWLIDANGNHFDVKLNWLMGHPTEFFRRL